MRAKSGHCLQYSPDGQQIRLLTQQAQAVCHYKQTCTHIHEHRHPHGPHSGHGQGQKCCLDANCHNDVPDQHAVCLLESRTKAGILRKSSSVRAPSAVSMAVSVPIAPTAKPISARTSAVCTLSANSMSVLTSRLCS